MGKAVVDLERFRRALSEERERVASAIADNAWSCGAPCVATPTVVQVTFAARIFVSRFLSFWTGSPSLMMIECFVDSSRLGSVSAS